MRWYRPVLAPGHARDGEDQFGGVPRALGPGGWPRCGTCGEPLTLLAQLAHHADRLPLGGAGRLLSIWQCENPATACDTWDPESEANAVLVHDPGPVSSPSDVRTYPEARVAEWLEGDDGVTAEALPQFFSVRGFRALSDTDVRAARPGTHLGGAPFWAHSPDEALAPPYELVLQLDGRDGWNGPDHFGGLAYVFLDRTVDPPAGAMFWQS